MRAPARSGRVFAVIAATLIATSLFVVVPPDAVAVQTPSGLARFKAAVGSVESGGRYSARNPVTGAYGKYQILPSNWPSWAKRYIGSASARPTPANQERVASGKMTSLVRWLGSWRRVAYWWLTGSSRQSGWSASARRYVEKVMTRYHRAGSSSDRSNLRVISDRSTAIRYSGRWRVAGHPGYGGDRVRYATASGASASLTFTGRGVVWHGPTGPTRGRARVYIDGKLVRTVDLRRPSFDPRASLFSTRWPRAGRHTIRIVVLGTSGRPMVAVDDFAIRL